MIKCHYCGADINEQNQIHANKLCIKMYKFSPRTLNGSNIAECGIWCGGNIHTIEAGTEALRSRQPKKYFIPLFLFIWQCLAERFVGWLATFTGSTTCSKYISAEAHYTNCHFVSMFFLSFSLHFVSFRFTIPTRFFLLLFSIEMNSSRILSIVRVSSVTHQLS